MEPATRHGITAPDAVPDLNGSSAHAGSALAARASAVVEHFFRHESGRLHGTLLRRFGAANLVLVEDVAQSALLQAMRTWSIGGVPPNPSAWITRVAINLAHDTLRRQRMVASKEPAIQTQIELQQTEPVDETDAEVRDNALRLMFVCCHPALANDAQTVLALKILCGFSTAEIARAFLSSEAAIEKQLTRTKQRIRDAAIGFEIPAPVDLPRRLDAVLATLYLLFNEGYKASGGERLLREELCQEAVRLTAILCAHPAGNVPRSHALLALMLLTAARFPSRLDADGALLRLHDQDRARWDPELIGAGLSELAAAATGEGLSEYHLQAAIAACHCTATDSPSTDWRRIVQYYDDLLRLKPSPIVALNRAVALANVDGAEAALREISGMAQRDRLDSYYLLHAVVGELHWRLGQHEAAAENFRRALQIANVGPEQLFLTQLLDRSAAPSDASAAEKR